MNQKTKLSLAIYTASQWHDDHTKGGIAMLSLSSTRTVHSEEHRQNLIADIRQDIKYICETGDEYNDDCSEEVKDLARLVALFRIVKHAVIGEEWLSDEEHLRINEALYQAGKL
jgi:hypothetical protein